MRWSGCADSDENCMAVRRAWMWGRKEKAARSSAADMDAVRALGAEGEEGDVAEEPAAVSE